jgi:manganese transport protein
VAGIAYVDPGNVAANTTAGSEYGFLLLWVIVAANLQALLIQYLSVKLGVVSGESLPRICRREYSGTTSRLLWLQAECVAIATDIAELVGGAIALDILFDLPLLVGAMVTAALSMGVLTLQNARSQRRFEVLVIVLLVVIALGFVYPAIVSRPDAGSFLGGLQPRLQGQDSLLLATAMLGATVMPHAVYLHSALPRDRRLSLPAAWGAAERRAQVRASRWDVMAAMAVAGGVNIAMLVAGASALHNTHVSSIPAAHDAYRDVLGPAAATLFAVALLASGVASSAVGTYAGTVIMDGFLRVRLPVLVRRVLTLIPSLLIISTGADPTQVLVLSQVVLSFGIPFALFPLVHMTSQRRLMGDLANSQILRRTGFALATLISLLNASLLVSLIST